MTAAPAPASSEPATQLADGLRVAGLTVRRGGRVLLDRVDLVVRPGEVVAVVGANGAGKTTLLDAVTGEVPASGQVGVGHVARVLQGSPLPGSLTVAEVLELACGDPDAAEDRAGRFGLTAALHRRTVELSTGMGRVLDLAVATARPHDVLLLDEPAAGLAAGEVELLAQLVGDHRDHAGVAVLLVEHDMGLVEAAADRVVVLDAGRVVRDGPGRGSTDHTTLDDRATARSLPARTAAVRDELAAIAAAGVPAAPPARHEVSTWTKLRLGLREFAAGLASVLILGVLNRVMKVELGIGLAVIGIVLASYNLAAPVALWVGHRSDQRPIAGRHRTPYILGGAVLVALTVAAAPHLADRLAAGVTVGSIALSTGVFAVMGVGMYGAGTVFFALLADLTPHHERAHAASVVYLMLMAGIVTGAALAGTLLDEAAQGRHTLFAVAGLVVLVCNGAAVWGLDPRELEGEEPEQVAAWQAIREVAAIRPARRFFVFTLLATLFIFLQQAVLEPYGGDVLGLSVRATAGFNAVQTVGVVVGMLVTGRGTADRAGHKRTAMVGLVGSSVAFAGLAAAAIAGSVPASWFAILAIGLSTGLFTVAVLALMMAMTVPERAALFMGAWTVAHGVADGLATAGGGVIQQVAVAVTGAETSAYALVFGLEGVGLAACIPLLRGLDVRHFARRIAAESARRSALAMGWIEDTAAGR